VKQFGLAGFVLFWLLAGCGKVGDPHPPAIRIPAKIDDLKASQTEASVTLTWTNPSRNRDGTKVDDLTVFQIFEGEKEIKTDSASLPGKPQSTSIPVSGPMNTRRIYTVEVTTRRGKVARSNEASIQIVDYPGAVSDLKGFMDQRRIQLTWKPPKRNPELADVYVIRRLDGGIPPQTVSETDFTDVSVEAGKTYRYTVSAGRGKSEPVLGPPSVEIAVIALDNVPPQIPSGLQVIESDSGAIIRWESNTEADLAAYRVYRRQDAASGFVMWMEVSKGTTSVLDSQFKPGFSYAVAAVDNDGHVSDRSEPTK
jgi:hypothetical protein